MEKLYDNKAQCCGCGACGAVCPTGAIVFASDGRFFYPRIDADKCVGCGKCASVCAFKLPKDETPNCRSAFALKAARTVRMVSSSGGAFTVLSDAVLARGGAVYGAAFDEAMRVVHLRAEDAAGRDRMRGSKYVRSDMTGVYDAIKADLAAGTPVLFTGTPCQVAAVKAVCGENGLLYTADLICHGPASPEIWRQFIALLEKRYGKKAVGFSFRDKAVSWREYSSKVTFADGSAVGANDLTGSFTEVFRYELCLAPSCAACRYASVHREGDLTVGDFWGVEKVFPSADDGAGVSALLVNTEKGERLLRAIEAAAELLPCAPEEIAAGQVNMKHSAVLSPESERFYAICEEKGLEKALAAYTRVGIRRRAKDAVKAVLKKG